MSRFSGADRPDPLTRGDPLRVTLGLIDRGRNVLPLSLYFHHRKAVSPDKERIISRGVRCLNAICEGADARYRQAVASYYYKEIAKRGTGGVLREMGLLWLP